MPARYPDAIGVEHISRFTKALVEAARHRPLDTPVPTCGDWVMADLVWHLAEVQDFWIHIIENRPTGGPSTYDRPTRPSDTRVVARLQNGLVGLVDALDRADSSDAAWSWSDEQTVGFTVRRQTHEALTHCIDGLLAADLPLPDVAPELAADGIDEVVHIMLPTSDEPADGEVALHCTDTDDRWTIDVGTGAATVAGTSLDINLWLWGRANTWPLSITGDVDQADALRAHIANQTQ